MGYVDMVKKFVIENFLFGDEGSLSDDTSFLESGIIDSTGILELVMFLEETYGFKIQDEELVPENLDNLKNVSRFIEKKLNGSSGSEV
jgi:acyl carrier protein